MELPGRQPRHLRPRPVQPRLAAGTWATRRERGEYYHLYINGQYWGLFNTCERPEASYGETYFGGRKEDYDVIKVEAGPYTVVRHRRQPGGLDAALPTRRKAG